MPDTLTAISLTDLSVVQLIQYLHQDLNPAELHRWNLSRQVLLLCQQKQAELLTLSPQQEVT